MAIAFVQSKIGVKSTDSSDHTVTFDTSPTEGNLLVAFIHHRNTVDETDITLSGWTDIDSAVSSAVGKGFFKIAGASESSAVTIDTAAVDPASGVMIIAEYSGITETAPLNVTNSYKVASESNSLLSSDIITTVNDALLLNFCGVRQGGNDGSFSGTNSFLVVEDGESTGSSFSGAALLDRTVTSTGTYNSTTSWTDGGKAGGVICAVEMDAAGGITGTASTTIAAFTGSAAGSIAVQGDADATMVAFTGSASGTVGATGITGDADTIIAAFTGAATGSVAVQGIGNATMAAFTGVAVGKIKITAAGNATISAITGVATGSIGIMGDALSTMAAFTGSATDSVGGGGMAPALRMLLRM